MESFWSLPNASIAGLGPSIEALFGTLPPRRYAARATISDPDASPKRVFLCTSGTLKVTKLLANGREILITVLDAGSIWSDCALLKGYWHGVFVETMSPAGIASVEGRAFESAMRGEPERLRTFVVMFSQQMSDALTLLEDFRRHDVASRLANRSRFWICARSKNS